MIRPNIDTVPSCGALLVHRIPFKTLSHQKSELEAIQEIHLLVNAPGTISLGYNTLGFDDEFLRFSFYRNLLPPYTHQYANQCGRMDLYPFTLLYYLFKPETIQWPSEDTFSLKLEAISAANQFHSGRAHDAMVDVETTLKLAQAFYQEKDMWEFTAGYFDKAVDTARLLKLHDALDFEHTPLKEALMVQGRFGRKKAYQAPVLGLGRHWHFKNQTLWLRLDSEKLLQAKPDNITDTTFVVRKKAGEKELLLPTLPRFMKHLDKNRLKLFEESKAYLSKNPALVKAICEYHCDYTYPEIESIDPDAALYQAGFPSNQETATFAAFHKAAPEDKWAVAKQLTHPVRHELALRVMGRHFSGYLPEEERAQFQAYLEQINDPEGKPLCNYRGERRRTQQEFESELAALSLEEQSIVNALIEA